MASQEGGPHCSREGVYERGIDREIERCASTEIEMCIERGIPVVDAVNDLAAVDAAGGELVSVGGGGGEEDENEEKRKTKKTKKN